MLGNLLAMPSGTRQSGVMATLSPQTQGLSAADLAWLDERLRTLPGAWSLDVVRDPAELSAVLQPADGDRFAATFLLERASGGYRLQSCRWDEMTVVAVFPALADAVAHVAAAAVAADRLAPFPHLQ